jgi:hypothetical protein
MAASGSSLAMLAQGLWTSVTLGGGGRPKVGTDWTQSLQKAVHGVQIALNIADVARRPPDSSRCDVWQHRPGITCCCGQPA